MTSGIAASAYGLDLVNVLFVTLDSCRADTVAQARLPFLKSVGKFRDAKTHGTYTFPAHKSFFMGYLPSVVEPPFEPYYVPEIRQLWRLREGRPRPLESVGVSLDGVDVLQAYRSSGFKVVGSGGVGWFTNPDLIHSFEDFKFFGPPMTASVFEPRRSCDFALNHLDDLFSLIRGETRFFLFINVSETHVPYDFGSGLFDSEVARIMTAASSIWGCKFALRNTTDVGANELKYLHRAQIRAIEEVDLKLERLVDRLPKPILLVVCGDHGECFGEDMLWGHGYAHRCVFDVPLLVSLIH